MRTVFWTEQAQSDLTAIHAFINQDSPHYATVTVRQLIAAVDQLTTFPESGRPVPEFETRTFEKLFAGRTESSTAWSVTTKYMC